MRKTVLFVLFAVSALAQPWSTILPNTRAIDWSVAGLPATFPDGETTPNPWTPPTRTQCGSTLSPLGGGQNDVPQIISALSTTNCAAGHYVLLGSGTFTISSQLGLYGANNVNNNVTLRGSGPMQTKLNVVSGGSIQIGASWGGEGSGLLTITYPKGTTSIVVGSMSGISPTDNKLAWLTVCDTGSGSGSCATPPSDNGGLFVCGDTTTCDQNGAIGGGTPTSWQHQQQTVLIKTATNMGNGTWTLTLSSPLYMPNYSNTTGGKISWPGAARQVTGFGIENLTLIGGLPNIQQAYASWIKGVRMIGAGDSFTVQACANCLIANSYWAPAALNLSSVSNILSAHVKWSADTLVINNIGAIGEMAEYYGRNVGIVTAYNMARDGRSTGSANVLDFDHVSFSSFDLWEGNMTSAFTEDNIWGTHALNTFFRNNLSCHDDPYVSPSPIAFEIDNFHRFENVVGNAIHGCGGYSSTSATNQVYYFKNLTDSLVTSTLLRWGNVSTVAQSSDSPTPNSGVRFNSSEVPSSLAAPNAAYSVPVPSNNNLPASFFLSTTAHPSGGTGLSWWKTCTSWTTFPTACASYTTLPFPIAGPDVTGGSYTNGYAYDNPANLAWKNLPVDTAYQGSYTITGSSWSNGVETLTISGLPGTQFLMGPFQLSGVNPACTSGATFNTAGEILITASTSTSVSYPLASNPGTACTGTFKWPNVRQFDERVYALDAAGGGTAPTIITSSLSNGTVGAAYSQTLAATGDTPITWDLASGSLTACNLSLNASTGAITGTPLSATICSFTARATNAAGNGTKPLSINIDPAEAPHGMRQTGAAVKR